MTFDTAVSKYYDKIHAFLYGGSGKDSYYADECCNSVFLSFSEKGTKIEDSAVYSWLFRTASNKLMEHYRKKSKERNFICVEDISCYPSEDADLCDQMITDKDIEEAKEKILSLLSPAERKLYECYFKQNMTYIEIAAKFGIDRNTASKRINIIRKKLEEEVRKMFTVCGAATVLRIMAALFDR